MQNEDRFHLCFGPYAPPAVKVSDELTCEIRGLVRVVAWSAGRIAWPCCKTTRLSLIVCADLAQALRRESNQAVAYWWGVDINTVMRWRRALFIQYKTEGYLNLKRAWVPETLSPEMRALGRGCIAHPDVIERMIKTRRARGPRNHKPWTADEEAVLGTAIDREIASRLGRSASQVKLHRQALKIPAFEQRNVPYFQTHPDIVTLDPVQLRQRRLALGLTQKQLGPRAEMSNVVCSQLETGLRRRVYRITLLRLATALSCEPDDLLSPAPKPELGNA